MVVVALTIQFYTSTEFPKKIFFIMPYTSFGQQAAIVYNFQFKEYFKETMNSFTKVQTRNL